MVAYKVSIRCNDSEVISVEQRWTEVIFLSTLSYICIFHLNVTKSRVRWRFRSPVAELL